MIKKYFFAFSTAVILINSSYSVKARESASPYYAMVSGGVTDVFDDGREGQFGFELQGKKYYNYFKPKTGFHFTSKEAKYFYVGGNFEYQFPTTNFEGVLGLAAGYYDKGKSKHLGHDLEFKSTIGFNYLLPKSYKIGLSLSHLSNAHLSNRNPGTEDISINISAPF